MVEVEVVVVEHTTGLNFTIQPHKHHYTPPLLHIALHIVSILVAWYLYH
jgi:hypothetical protein